MTRFNKWLIGGVAALVAALALAQTATRFAAIRVDNLTANRVVLGGGTSQLTPLAAGTTVTVLHGDAAGTPSFAAVSLTADVANILPAANGGLGISTVTDDTVAVANGSGWASTAVPNCTDTGGNHLNYTAATNSISCGTTSSGGGGVTQTTGNSTLTFSTGCTANQTPSFRYVVTGDTVTLQWPTITCTSNGATFDSNANLNAAARPANPRTSAIFPVSDNGGEADFGCIRVNADGSVNLFRRTSGNTCSIGWTASGNKRFPAGAMSYNITD